MDLHQQQSEIPPRLVHMDTSKPPTNTGSEFYTTNFEELSSPHQQVFDSQQHVSLTMPSASGQPNADTHQMQHLFSPVPGDILSATAIATHQSDLNTMAALASPTANRVSPATPQATTNLSVTSSPTQMIPVSNNSSQLTDNNSMGADNTMMLHNSMFDVGQNALFASHEHQLQQQQQQIQTQVHAQQQQQQIQTQVHAQQQQQQIQAQVHAQQQQQQQAHIQAQQQQQAQIQAHAQQQQAHIQAHAQQQQHMLNEMMNSQASIEHHPIVPSQRVIEQPTHRSMDEENERVAAAAQQVMAQQIAQQYAMLQHHQQQAMTPTELIQTPSQETPHVVLSQMANLNNSTPTTPIATTPTPTIHKVKSDNISLHNAIVHHQHQQQNMVFINETVRGAKRNMPDANNADLGKKKSRRHTVSSSYRPTLNIDTKNLSNTMAPRSAAVSNQQQHPQAYPYVVNNDIDIQTQERKTLIECQKQALGTITLPPPPTPQELGLKQPQAGTTAKDYENMTRDQLIARLIVLETEKLNNETNAEKSSVKSVEEEEEENNSPDTPMDIHNQKSANHQPITDEDKSTIDDDEEEDEAASIAEAATATVAEPEPEKPKQCKWKECGEIFTDLQKLISHINDTHVGSGKPTYCCEWEGCARNQKPFTKRHKMYNHLRTHTGERPFVCNKPDCGKRFSRPDSLTTHIKTHSNVRPFICLAKGCGKAYYHSRSLKKHEKTHEMATTPVLSTPNSVIQFPNSSGSTPFSTTSAPATAGMHSVAPVDYINSQMPMTIHSQSLPNSPHPTLQQQQPHSFTLLQQQSQPQQKQYTPSHNNMLSFTPAGMVEQQQQQPQNNEQMLTQQHTVFDSVNQQQQQSFEFRQV